MIDHIDNGIKDCLGIDKKFYGLCKLSVDTESETYPYVIGSARKERVSVNDAYDVAVYHRILSGTANNDENFSWGRKQARRHNLSMRMVVILKSKMGEDYIDQIITALPDVIVNPAFNIAELGDEVSKIVDHEGICSQEFGDAWRDKISVHKFILYAIEYTLSYIPCDNCVSTSTVV